MRDFSIKPSEEGGHQSSFQRLWSGSWYFDFFDSSGQPGGYLRIGLYPNLGVTWYWACVVGWNRPLVAVLDHDLPLPALPSLTLAGSNLSWLRTNTPGSAWLEYQIHSNCTGDVYETGDHQRFN